MYNDISNQIKKVAKYLHLHEVCIDSCIFKLHYVVTVVIFVVYSLLVTISTYAGDPIDCHTREDAEKGYSVMGDYLDWCISIIPRLLSQANCIKVLLHSRNRESVVEG